MVYMEPTALGLDPLLASWLATLPAAFAQHADLLRNAFNVLVRTKEGHQCTFSISQQL